MTDPRERAAATNGWAFLHRARRPRPYDWRSLIAWSAAEPASFSEAVRDFAGPGDPALLARTLLHADLRPDDQVLLGADWPHPALLGTRFCRTAHADPLAEAAEAGATVLVVPAAALPPGFSPPTRLRLVLCLGGPPPIREQARLSGHGLVLLAQDGPLMWGNPLDPAPAPPIAPLRFFHPPD
ncbi:MAG TPA: hypothetical protein VFA03_10490 [Acetobacteraceae bacterium]|nr:hypothetical protein [Acetobacteraceae bacterium]